MGDRSTFLRNERDRSERERERDIRSERERDRDRERHDQQPMFSRQFQSNLPPRFQKQQAERNQHQFLRVGSGGSSSSPQPLSGTGSSSQGAPSSQGALTTQGAPSTQMFDPRWTGSTTHGGSTLHFPGSLPSEYGNFTYCHLSDTRVKIKKRLCREIRSFVSVNKSSLSQ